MTQDLLMLRRPLVAFDLETTGLDISTDRVVEICCVRLDVDGSRQVRTRRLNPEMPISPEATAVHGIRDEDVAGEPTFVMVARSLKKLLEGCDLTGFNVEQFDLPMLSKEFKRADMSFPDPDVLVIDSRRIFLRMEPRDLRAAYRFYCNSSLEHAHTAEADAVAALDILQAQVARYDDLPRSVAELQEFLKPARNDWVDHDGKILWRGNKAVLGFGKHRFRSLESLVSEEPDYLRWVVDKAAFSPQVVAIVREALEGRFPEQQTRPQAQQQTQPRPQQPPQQQAAAHGP